MRTNRATIWKWGGVDVRKTEKNPSDSFSTEDGFVWRCLNHSFRETPPLVSLFDPAPLSTCQKQSLLLYHHSKLFRLNVWLKNWAKFSYLLQARYVSDLMLRLMFVCPPQLCFFRLSLVWRFPSRKPTAVFWMSKRLKGDAIQFSPNFPLWWCQFFKTEDRWRCNLECSNQSFSKPLACIMPLATLFNANDYKSTLVLRSTTAGSAS